MFLNLELKLLADVGLVGFPSVGKSTLLSVVSKAKPKIGAYHFTTIKPNLGVVSTPDGRSFVLADLPGLASPFYSLQQFEVYLLSVDHKTPILY